MDDEDLVNIHLAGEIMVTHCGLNRVLSICVTSLVMAMAQDHLDAFAVCYTKAVDRLQRVCTL